MDLSRNRGVKWSHLGEKWEEMRFEKCPVARAHRFACGRALEHLEVAHVFINSVLMVSPWCHVLTVSDHGLDVF